MGALERFGLRAAAGDAGAPNVVPETAAGVRGRGNRAPVVRSGTALEVAEVAWLAEGVGRELALSIPSVVACRNLIVGTVVQLGVFRYRGGARLEPGYLFSKPDPSTSWPATIGGTVDDLLFRGRAFWHVLERDAEGVPVRARWTPVDDVSAKSRSTGGSYSELEGYTIAGVPGLTAIEDVIRFDSPLPGVLDVGGRTLMSAIELELAARRLAGAELPAGTLTNLGQELSDEEGAELVDGFLEARRRNGIAWLQGVEYKRESVSSADLQMIEARANVATDVARLFGVQVSMIGASPSGGASALLYSNLTQQLAISVATSVAPHLRTLEATLSDVIPRGQRVAFDVQTYLRSDPQAAADYAIALLGAGIIAAPQARSLLGIPESSGSDLTPGSV